MRLLVLQHRPVTPVGLVGERVLGGVQLVARAFGEKVYFLGGLEVDYPSVYLTSARQGDALFRGLTPEQRMMQMREDSFDLPESAVPLMRNDTCENQADGGHRFMRSGPVWK